VVGEPAEPLTDHLPKGRKSESQKVESEKTEDGSRINLSGFVEPDSVFQRMYGED